MELLGVCSVAKIKLLTTCSSPAHWPSLFGKWSFLPINWSGRPSTQLISWGIGLLPYQLVNTNWPD